uniref:Uncharacterized protein n=1 Tax=Lotharella oceanica TaxID=641309 RepID=A0A7S2U1H7_9EUKA|mmetsp:Transcript_5947/g.11928  ORF Transcript_5947/g.11928 Transcript_5947/m.11928 type:complete len:315 (+) Transcript_5947:648-1592(+)
MKRKKQQMGVVSSSSSSTCDTAISHLRNSKGDSIYLVGTAHISNNSASLVSRVFSGVSPDLIMVELDKKRLNVVTDEDAAAAASDDGRNQDSSTTTSSNEQKQQQKKKNLVLSDLRAKFASLKKTLSHPKESILSFVIGKIITKMYQGIGKEGIPVGGEFIAAFKYASDARIPVLLGDRPIDLTFERLGQAASTEDLTKILTPDEEDAKELGILYGVNGEEEIGSAQDLAMQVEMLKNRETVGALQGYIARKSPELYAALIGERDAYMAESLSGAIQKEYKNIVAVVGFAHLNGIEKYLQESGFKLVDMCYSPA